MPLTRINGTQIADNSLTADDIVYSLNDAYGNGGSGVGRIVTASAGPVLIDAGGAQALVITGTFDVAGPMTVTTTGSSTFSGPVSFSVGLTGSHTKLVDGTNYLLPGQNISLATGSNGSVTITALSGTSSQLVLYGGTTNANIASSSNFAYDGQAVNVVVGGNTLTAFLAYTAPWYTAVQPSRIRITNGTYYTDYRNTGTTTVAGAWTMTTDNHFVVTASGGTTSGYIALNAAGAGSGGGYIDLSTSGTGAGGHINLNPNREIRLNGSAGTSGQVLTTNGGGSKPTWNNISGSLLGIYVASGSTYTTGARTTTIFVRLVGGGGGGGGCTSVGAAAGAAGGGGAGGYAEKIFAVTPSTAYTISIGTGGTGVSGAGGNNGTDTTFTVGATTVTAKGGSGAVAAISSTTLTAFAGGAGGTASTNGDLNGAGENGDPGFTLVVATPIVMSGNGGNSIFGAGGIGRSTAGNGNNAIGFGSGGGGAATGASAARTGGNGSPGIIIVTEYS